MTTLDFAAAWNETADEPLVVRLDALDWRVSWPRRVGRWLTRKPTSGLYVTLPGSMPAGLRLHMWSVKQQDSERTELTYGEMTAAGRYLFGAATFQKLLDARFEEQHLTEAVMAVLALYASREAVHREQTADAPSGGSAAPGTSSATSGPSKPTSSGSTDSTSPLLSVLAG